MSKLSKFAKRKLGAEVSTLVEAGYLDESLKLTDGGKLALQHIIAEKFETEFVAAAQVKLDAEKKSEESK